MFLNINIKFISLFLSVFLLTSVLVSTYNTSYSYANGAVVVSVEEILMAMFTAACAENGIVYKGYNKGSEMMRDFEEYKKAMWTVGVAVYEQKVKETEIAWDDWITFNKEWSDNFNNKNKPKPKPNPRKQIGFPIPKSDKDKEEEKKVMQNIKNKSKPIPSSKEQFNPYYIVKPSFTTDYLKFCEEYLNRKYPDHCAMIIYLEGGRDPAVLFSPYPFSISPDGGRNFAYIPDPVQQDYHQLNVVKSQDGSYTLNPNKDLIRFRPHYGEYFTFPFGTKVALFKSKSLEPYFLDKERARYKLDSKPIVVSDVLKVPEPTLLGQDNTLVMPNIFFPEDLEDPNTLAKQVQEQKEQVTNVTNVTNITNYKYEYYYDNQPDPNPNPNPDPNPNPNPNPDPNPNPNPDTGTGGVLDFLKKMFAPPSKKLDFNPLMRGVVNKFPFCVPFDLINSFSVLKSERKTPVYTVEIVKNHPVVFDFKPLDNFAKISRSVILLLFLVWLILVTRGLIKG